MTPEQAVSNFGDKSTHLKIKLLNDTDSGLVLLEGSSTVPDLIVIS